MTSECWDLARVKKEYEKLEKKYKLASFEKLNEEFDIEKIAEKETSLLLREIRKTIADKIIAYIRFIEVLMNPSNGPMFFFTIVKGINLNDKSLVEKVYKKLASFELDIISLDNSYEEKREAEFLSRVYKEWQELKEDIEKLVVIMKESWEKQGDKIEKDYFG